MRRLLVLTLACLTLGGVSPADAQRDIRFATFLHEQSVVNVYVVKPFIEAVNAEVGNEVRLRPYWGGALGRDATKYYDILRDGVADIAFFDPGYTPGRFRDVGLFELPFLARNGTEGSLAMWRMFEKGRIGGFDEIKLLGLFSTDVYQIHTTKPVSSIFDLQGLKIRAAAAIHGDVVRALKGVPVGLPITQVTESLSRGVIDGALTGFSTIVTFRMMPVVKYHYEIPLGVLPLAIGMNRRTWDSLPPRVKAAIDKHSGDVFARNGGRGFDKRAEEALAEAKRLPDHTIIPLDDAAGKGREWAQALHAEWIAKGDDRKQKFDMFLKILDEIRAGR